MLRHGAGARVGGCQSAVFVHLTIGGMAEPTGRSPSGAHFVLGPGRHRAPATLAVWTAAQRVGRSHSLPGSGPGRNQAAQQSAALRQVVTRSFGKVPLATCRPTAYATERGGELALAIWDESVLEKPESIALEGLCPIRSSKTARLKRIKPGCYNPPGGPPVFVSGLQWLTVMLAGMQGGRGG